MEYVSYTDYVSGIQFSNCSKLAKSLTNGNNFTAFQHDVPVKPFDIVLLLLSSLVLDPNFIIISSLVLEL